MIGKAGWTMVSKPFPLPLALSKKDTGDKPKCRN